MQAKGGYISTDIFKYSNLKLKTIPITPESELQSQGKKGGNL